MIEIKGQHHQLPAGRIRAKFIRAHYEIAQDSGESLKRTETPVGWICANVSHSLVVLYDASRVFAA